MNTYNKARMIIIAILVLIPHWVVIAALNENNSKTSLEETHRYYKKLCIKFYEMGVKDGKKEEIDKILKMFYPRLYKQHKEELFRVYNETHSLVAIDFHKYK